MTEGRQTAPQVYSAINAITRKLASSGIAKTQVNKNEGYLFRGVDDVMQSLAPLLAQHRLCVLPRVLERAVEKRTDVRSALLLSVCLKVAFDFVSVRDGSMHTIEVTGEALDGGDKATAKAMTAAWKQAMLQAFCIPVGQPDPDAETHRLEDPDMDAADPVTGWEQWSQDLCELITGCTTVEAMTRVQIAYRGQLRALSKRRTDLFTTIGAAIAQKRRELSAFPNRLEIDPQKFAAIPPLEDAVVVRGSTEEIDHA